MRPVGLLALLVALAPVSSAAQTEAADMARGNAARTALDMPAALAAYTAAITVEPTDAPAYWKAALTLLDMYLTPKVIADAWDYFNNVQTKDVKYVPLLRETDMPPTHLNRGIMAEYREEMKKLYYDPAKYDTYLEQLGIEYPTVRKK